MSVWRTVVVGAATCVAAYLLAITLFHGSAPGSRRFSAGELFEVTSSGARSTRNPAVLNYLDTPLLCQSPSNAPYSLGEMLGGLRFSGASIPLHVMEDGLRVECEVEFGEDSVIELKKLIDEDYRVELLADGVPASFTQLKSTYAESHPFSLHETFEVKAERESRSLGFPLGGIFQNFKGTTPVSEPTYFVNNHLDLTVYYSPIQNAVNEFNIVELHVEPFSVEKTAFWSSPSGFVHRFTDEYSQTLRFSSNSTNKLMRSVRVKWQLINQRAPFSSPIFDVVNMDQKNSLIYSIVGVIVLLSIKTWIGNSHVVRAFDGTDELLSELDLLHPKSADIEKQTPSLSAMDSANMFEPLSKPIMFAGMVGSGVQVFTVAFLVIALINFNVVLPSKRGSVSTAIGNLWVASSLLAGYASTRVFRTFSRDTRAWLCPAVVSTFLVPGIVLFFLFLAESFLYLRQERAVIPLYVHLQAGTVDTLIFQCLPLSAGGALAAWFRPVDVRFPWYRASMPGVARSRVTPVIMLVTGFLSFSVVHTLTVEWMRATWNRGVEVHYGVVLIQFFALVATCSYIGHIVGFLTASKTDNRGWWITLLSSGAGSIYLFMFTVWWFIYRSNFPIVGSTTGYVMFVTQMAVISVLFFFGTSVLGFLSLFWFGTVKGSITSS